MVNLTIDGKKVEVPEGTTVLRAAEKAGITIPTLCDHPGLTPFGGCRLCVVEIEGARGPVTSCTMPVSNNMVVRTDTPKLHEVRKFVLSLLFSERNHYCMYCQKSGSDCDLQNAAYTEDMTHWTLQPNWSRFAVDASHKHFVLDQNRCILCRRCIRACGELVGNFTLGVHERGANTLLVADFDTPLGQSSCVSCGMCVQVCPTGALIDRDSAYQGLAKQNLTQTFSTCAGCSVGCGIEVLTRDNRLVRIEGDWNAPVNEGLMCEEGRYLPLRETRERITTPLIKKNGAQQPATWGEALAALAAKLKPLAGKNGKGVAALASTRLPAEALYLFQQMFADKLGSGMVTSIEENITTAVPAAVAQELGGVFEGKLADLKQADCVVTIGVDLAASRQVAGFFVKRALPKNTQLIVIDSQDNKLRDLAHYALKPKADADYDLLLGLMAEIIKQGQTKGAAPYYDLSKSAAAAVSQKTGIPEATLTTVARLINTAQKPVFVYGKGLTGPNAAPALKALVALAQLTNAAVVGMKGQANSLAAAAYGLDKAFAVKASQAVYLALGDDEPRQRLIQALSGAPFIAVQASYASPVTAMADVVLPVTTWAEQDGHYVNLEGRVQTAHRALTPPETVHTNLEALQTLADTLGFKPDNNWQPTLKKRLLSVAITAE